MFKDEIISNKFWTSAKILASRSSFIRHQRKQFSVEDARYDLSFQGRVFSVLVIPSCVKFHQQDVKSVTNPKQIQIVVILRLLLFRRPNKSQALLQISTGVWISRKLLHVQ